MKSGTTLIILLTFILAGTNLSGQVIQRDSSFSITQKPGESETYDSTSYYNIDFGNNSTTDVQLKVYSRTFPAFPLDSDSLGLFQGGLTWFAINSRNVENKVVLAKENQSISSGINTFKDSLPPIDTLRAHVDCDSACPDYYTEHPGYVLSPKKYIGVKFKKGNNFHYGYIQLAFAGGEPGTGVTGIKGWAYETEPGTPILTKPLGTGKIISGTVYNDKNENCAFDSSDQENGINGIQVIAENSQYIAFAKTDTNGQYFLQIPESDSAYTIRQNFTPSQKARIKGECSEPPYKIKAKNISMDTTGLDFGNKVQKCSYLSVNTSFNTPPRPCFKHKAKIQVRNKGLLKVKNSELKLILDEHLIPESSTPSWNQKNGDTIIYDLGTIPGQSKKRITITDSVTCNQEITGLAQCLKAKVTPHTNCTGDNTLDSSALYFQRKECLEDSAVFTIKNHDTAKAMNTASRYKVYYNDTMVHSNTFQLDAGESFDVKVPAYGQTIGIEMVHYPDDPGKSTGTMAFIEACGDSLLNADRGYVLDFPIKNNSPNMDINCKEVVNSYDPNDKLVTPAGMTKNNYIDSTTTLNYTVRFQNTGTAPARKVVVLDTLGKNLDPSTLTITGNSHDMDWDIYGSNNTPVLKFTFDDINLPDSTSNESESHGYVSFRIEQNPGNQNGTVIQNKAGIIFDYNEPIITNTVTHEVNNNYPVEDLSKGEGINDSRVTAINKGNTVQSGISVYPNPSNGQVHILPKQHNVNAVRVYNTTGRLIKKYQNAPETLNFSEYTPGTYILTIQTRNQVFQRKVIIQ